MDIERLKELKDQIKGVHDGINGDDFKLLYDLLPLVNEAIARQSATSEEVQREIERLTDVLEQTREAAKELKEQKYTVNMLPVYEKIKSIDLAITALQAYQPWITVRERLPDSGEPVLITFLGFHDGKPYSDGVAKWCIEENGYKGGWVWEIDGCEVAVEITHWKPLPEPPKGE